MKWGDAKFGPKVGLGWLALGFSLLLVTVPPSWSSYAMMAWLPAMFPPSPREHAQLTARGSARLALRSSVALFVDIGTDKLPVQIYGCGGTWVAPDKILTAFHCVSDKIQIESVSGKKWGFSVAYSDETVDLAVLKIKGNPDTDARPAEVSTDVMAGDPVWQVGSPSGEPFVVTRGVISKIVTDSFSNCDPSSRLGTRKHQILLVNATGWSGSSGGGVFDDSGKLVGVVVRGSDTSKRICKNKELVVTDVGGPLWGYAVGPLTISEVLSKIR